MKRDKYICIKKINVHSFNNFQLSHLQLEKRKKNYTKKSKVTSAHQKGLTLELLNLLTQLLVLLIGLLVFGLHHFLLFR